MSRARDLANGTISGAFSADSPTLVVDATNNRVGVGTASPTKDLELSLLKAMRMQTGSTTYDFTPTAGATDQLVLNSSQTTVYDFKMAGTTKVSITTNGLTFNGDTAAANALDDYEEGTWTPTAATGFPVGFQATAARYWKIGSMVGVTCYVNAKNDGVYIQIGGLPFTPANYSSISVGHATMTVREERIDSGSPFLKFTLSSTDTGTFRYIMCGAIYYT